MESLWLLVPLSVLLAFLIGWFFWWAADSGQFDDLSGPGQRVLQDDDSPPDIPEIPPRAPAEEAVSAHVAERKIPPV